MAKKKRAKRQSHLSTRAERPTRNDGSTELLYAIMSDNYYSCDDLPSTNFCPNGCYVCAQQ